LDMSSKLKEDLKDKEYRDAFVAAYVRNGVAFQIRTMRDSRGWDQKKLAEKMGNPKLQPIISRYENPDYGRYSMTTLLELAQAFDVGLIVKFAPFSELIKRDDAILDEPLDVDSYAKDLLAPQRLKATPISDVQNLWERIDALRVSGYCQTSVQDRQGNAAGLMRVPLSLNVAQPLSTNIQGA